MALWRKHRFISLEEQHGRDRIEAGSQFIVKRVGSTCVNDAKIENSEQLFAEFYKHLLELFDCEHGCKLRLIVDLRRAVLCSKDGDILTLKNRCVSITHLFCRQIHTPLAVFYYTT